jgi:hypothetical protein
MATSNPARISTILTDVTEEDEVAAFLGVSRDKIIDYKVGEYPIS